MNDTVRRGHNTLARGNLVWLCEHTDLPVPAVPVVFPIVYLDTLSLAGVAPRVEPGSQAERYVCEFDAKWLRGGAPADEPLVGSGDIQSLADLGNSLEVVRTMRIAPVTKEAILRLVAATLAPIVPLTLTMMPLEELLRKLFGILF